MTFSFVFLSAGEFGDIVAQLPHNPLNALSAAATATFQFPVPTTTLPPSLGHSSSNVSQAKEFSNGINDLFHFAKVLSECFWVLLLVFALMFALMFALVFAMLITVLCISLCYYSSLILTLCLCICLPGPVAGHIGGPVQRGPAAEKEGQAHLSFGAAAGGVLIKRLGAAVCT